METPPRYPQDRAKLYNYSNGESFRSKTVSEVFTGIYQERVWDEVQPEESVSGAGSSQFQTRELVQALPRLFSKYHIQSVLDIPCGDFNWMQRVVPGLPSYTGADIVSELIERNQRQYGNERVRFVQLNLLTDALPAADLILCRDCLVHFSFEHVRKALDTIRQSDCTYLLTTTFPGQEINEDIVTGGWRPLNFERAPFHFPPPLEIINEQCTEMNGIFGDKSLALWKIK
jgi:hypothetical protein